MLSSAPPRGRTLVGAAAIAGALALAVPAAAPAATAKPRLENGPQVYRLKPTGEKFGDRLVTTYTYAVVFKLSRVTIGPTFAGDDEGEVQAGEFSLAGIDLPGYTHDHLYSRKYRPQNCVVAYFDPDRNEVSAKDGRKLDRIQAGQKVSVTVRPLASPNPRVGYGHTYRRKVTMRRSNRPDLSERGVQRQLRAIGCHRR